MPDNQQRYRLTLTMGGRPTMDGWWASEKTARRKFAGLVGEYGSIDGATIVLVDTADGEQVLASWP
ncbi:hypothetical protein [Streptomyces himalayensis]|uniref:Uncharacterized protein n=1 Tax=Streptomyces himalayensis subsp. himalayensis TaxID=2756131 RepID=A0A7W0IE43_9ACTN|nr:hypothetical protein [Streptomyces himalayensis]MBA2951977.1 hypothetical protein [Streptomyces himalayensis subsp. himalayensis]